MNALLTTSTQALSDRQDGYPTDQPIGVSPAFHRALYLCPIPVAPSTLHEKTITVLGTAFAGVVGVIGLAGDFVQKPAGDCISIFTPLLS